MTGKKPDDRQADLHRFSGTSENEEQANDEQNWDTAAGERFLRGFGVDEEKTSSSAVRAFQQDIDPQLVNAGWGFEPAKSVEHGKTDQSLVNHVRCGVFAIARINQIVSSRGRYELSEEDLRDMIALFVLHDLHKLNPDRDASSETRFDIPREEVDAYAEKFGLYEFAGSDDDETLQQMFHDCAIDHHDDWAAHHDQTSPEFDQLRPFVRLADAFASSETPDQTVGRRVQSALDAAYPGESFVLRHHALNDVTGLLTNLINMSLAEVLDERGYDLLLLYQDGCVYLADESTPEPVLNKEFVSEIFDTLRTNIRQSHEAYRDATRLRDNLATRPHGFYGINDQDFFYAGAARVLNAIVLRAVSDADPDDDPTESMCDSMAALEEHLPMQITRTREPVGLARLADTVHRSFVNPVLDGMDDDRSAIEATCEVFDVPEKVRQGLEAAAADEDIDLTAGGKWDYAYGIGQAVLDIDGANPESLYDRVTDGLTELSPEWTEIVERHRSEHVQTEIVGYLEDTVSLGGRSHGGTRIGDTFEEYGGSRRGKVCSICSRGTSGTKGNMKAPKSLTTLQAGYSNHIAVDAGKPDKLLVCVPCQVEFSLRETGSTRREGGRLFIHLVPDYYYTPLSWRAYTQFTGRFSGNSRTSLDGLAEAVLALGKGDDALGDFADALINEEYGRSMIETLDQGFDPNSHFGARTLSYFKQKDNDTEFQFFGVFVALSLSAYAGLRVLVSESPIPDVRGRDFKTMARIGGGFTQVDDFYGTEVPLSTLQDRLNAAAALVRLGYGTDRNDALFAKYLRITRNQLLPGSHLLKRLAQADDGSDERYLLEEARVLDETTGLNTDS